MCHSEDFSPKNPGKQKDLSNYGSLDLQDKSKGLDSSLPFVVQNDRKSAVTLAETLITLVIVGVVAAMTIPVLMNKIQEHQYHSALKKNFSVFNQALRYAYGSNLDDFKDWEYVHSVKGAEEIVQRLSKYMSVAKICGHTDGSCFVPAGMDSKNYTKWGLTAKYLQE